MNPSNSELKKLKKGRESWLKEKIKGREARFWAKELGLIDKKQPGAVYYHGDKHRNMKDIATGKSLGRIGIGDRWPTFSTYQRMILGMKGTCVNPARYDGELLTGYELRGLNDALNHANILFENEDCVIFFNHRPKSRTPKVYEKLSKLGFLSVAQDYVRHQKCRVYMLTYHPRKTKKKYVRQNIPLDVQNDFVETLQVRMKHKMPIDDLLGRKWNGYSVIETLENLGRLVKGSYRNVVKQYLPDIKKQTHSRYVDFIQNIEQQIANFYEQARAALRPNQFEPPLGMPPVPIPT